MNTHSRAAGRVLVALALVALAIACSDNPALEVRYQAEKMYEQTERRLEELRMRPDMGGAQLKQNIADSYGDIFQHCLQGLSEVDSARYPVESREIATLAHQAASRLTQMYYTIDHYDTCVTILSRLLTEVDMYKSDRMITYINLGQCLQAAGQWDSALAVYDNAVDSFYPPISSNKIVGRLFNLPTHVLRVIARLGDSTAFNQRFGWAESYYQRLIDDYPGTIVVTPSHSNLAQIYQMKGDWEKAIEHLAMMKNPAGATLTQARLEIADIYARNLRQLATALNHYDDLMADLQPADSNLIPLIKLKKASVKMDQRKYSEARDILVDVRENHRGAFSSSPLAQYTLARSFELEGNFNRALAEYKILLEKYRESDEALSTYLYLAREFEEQGRHGEATRWYQDAARVYDELIARGSGTIDEARGLLFKSDLAGQQGRWQETAQMLTDVFDKFPKHSLGQRAMVNAIRVHQHKLNNPQIADSLRQVLRRSLARAESPTFES
ncbi:tetratricopeptide repeat protein [candidate division GN15 bacterium]|nr:tetratricopeptide repeat protein [candidate division GN15 bacterium]